MRPYVNQLDDDDDDRGGGAVVVVAEEDKVSICCGAAISPVRTNTAQPRVTTRADR